MGVLLDYINPEWPEGADAIMQFLESHKVSQKAADAINLYIQEILKRWESTDWDWLEDPEYHPEVKKIFAGKEDRRKQSAIYISMAKDGSPSETPKQFSEEDAEAAIDYARRYQHAVSGGGAYYKVIRIAHLKQPYRPARHPGTC